MRILFYLILISLFISNLYSEDSSYSVKLKAYLSDKIKHSYPLELVSTEIEGNVEVIFTVNELGKVADIKVDKNKTPKSSNIT